MKNRLLRGISWVSVQVMLITAFAASVYAHDALDHDGHAVVHDHDHMVDEDGLFGGAFSIVGEILAFPFRLVGDIFDWIF